MSESGRVSPTAKTIMAFDYGTRSIGVAVGQTITRTANPLTELTARDGIPEWDHIKKLLDEWQPDLLVIGLPLNMDGSESELTQRAKKFANRLHGRFGLAIAMADERLSSFAAKGEIIERTGSRKFKQHKVDSLAATIILESWFNQQTRNH
ncbi:MAG: putative Holliday junction resolvase [Oceanicoccus sp.]|jgi:putative Holliday junction resolvase